MADDSSVSLDDLINRAVARQGNGDLRSAISLNYWGLNKFATKGTLLPANRDDMGLVLFTRPLLNLTYNNLTRHPKFEVLLDKQPNSIPSAVRMMLDPQGTNDLGLKSALFDNRQAFIPILTNTIQTLGGMPDATIRSYTSPEGMRKETWSKPDDIYEINGNYPVSATFDNIIGDPVSLLFDIWLTYQAEVSVGDRGIQARMAAMLDDYKDYETRVYRLVLDDQYRKVNKISSCIAGYPTSFPSGNMFNYKRVENSRLNADNQTIDVQFDFTGFRYNESVLVRDFNRTVIMFNKLMDPKVRKSHYVKIPRGKLVEFNFFGYPYIDEASHELEWYIER